MPDFNKRSIFNADGTPLSIDFTQALFFHIQMSADTTLTALGTPNANHMLWTTLLVENIGAAQHELTIDGSVNTSLGSLSLAAGGRIVVPMVYSVENTEWTMSDTFPPSAHALDSHPGDSDQISEGATNLFLTSAERTTIANAVSLGDKATVSLDGGTVDIDGTSAMSFYLPVTADTTLTISGTVSPGYQYYPLITLANNATQHIVTLGTGFTPTGTISLAADEIKTIEVVKDNAMSSWRRLRPLQVSGAEITAASEKALRQYSPEDILSFINQHAITGLRTSFTHKDTINFNGGTVNVAMSTAEAFDCNLTAATTMTATGTPAANIIAWKGQLVRNTTGSDLELTFGSGTEVNLASIIVPAGEETMLVWHKSINMTAWKCQIDTKTGWNATDHIVSVSGAYELQESDFVPWGSEPITYELNSPCDEIELAGDFAVANWVVGARVILLNETGGDVTVTALSGATKAGSTRTFSNKSSLGVKMTDTLNTYLLV